jgi:hypothetical protein
MHFTSRIRARGWTALGTLLGGGLLSFGLLYWVTPQEIARPESPADLPGAAVGSCFQGTPRGPVAQRVVDAPSPSYYIRAYPTSTGTMDVRISNGSGEVQFFNGYVMSIEADYIPASRTTVIVATVSDVRCGPPGIIYVRAAQLDDGAHALRHPFAYRSPHATGAYHRDLCETGATTQTLIVMEGNNPIVPTDAPYLPEEPGRSDATQWMSRMQCPTFHWNAGAGFVSGTLQSCGGCPDLDGKPCQDACFRTPGVMRAGQCDLSRAIPLCNLGAGQVCRLDGSSPRCESL